MFLIIAPQVHAGLITRAPNNLGLVGYWPMNEGTTTFVGDFSGYGNAGTTTNIAFPPTSTSGWTNGRLGKAMRFDGTNDSVEIADNGGFDGAAMTRLTVAAWVLPITATVNGGIVDKAVLTSFGLQQGGGTNNWQIVASSNTCNVESASNLVDVGKWQFMVMIFVGSTHCSLYKNGVQIANDSTVGASITDSANNVRIGVEGTVFSNALIDDVRIYNRALSASEIQTLYKSGAITRKLPDNRGLVGYWPMNEGTTTFVGDFSGNGNTGTTTNIAFPPTVTSGWTNGKLGKAMRFDGSNDYVAMGNVLDIERTQSFTIGLWTKAPTNSPTALMAMVGKTQTGGNVPGYFLLLQGDVANDPYGVNLRGTTVGQEVSAQFTHSVSLTEWRHVVATYDGSSLASGVSLYENGVSLARTITNDTLASSISNTGPFQIGARNAATAPYNGLIDDVRIYNRELTAAEVYELYRTTSETKKVASERGLVGYWSFNEGTTTFVGDFSGNGNTGTTTNIAFPSTSISGWSNGKLGKAMNFDGSDDYVSLGRTPRSIQNLQDMNFTVCTWIFPRSSGEGGLGTIADNFVDGSGGMAFLIRDTGGDVLALQLSVDHNPTNTYTATVDNVVTLGVWQHVCATHTWPLRSGDIYKNGTAVSLGDDVTGSSSAGEDTSDQAMYIGNISSGTTRTFDGLIDDLRIYKRVLTPYEIYLLYNSR